MDLRWRQIHFVYLKRAIVSVAFSLVVSLALGIYELSGNVTAVRDAELDRLKTMPVWGWFLGILASIPYAGIRNMIDGHPAIVSGVFWGLFLFGALHEGTLRRLLHFRLWPDRPFFFELPLDEAPNRALAGGVWAADPRRKLSRFEGRASDFEWLRQFVHCPKPFAWASLYGPPGRGKTRVALEWCERLGRKGWDAGLLDETVAIDELRYWRPRKSTVLVVDEAFQRNSLIPKLVAALGEASRRSRHPVRMLFLDHAPYYPELGEGNVAVGGAAVSDPPHRLLGPLDDHDAAQLIKDMAPEMPSDHSATIVAAAKGEPLLVLMLWDEAVQGIGPIDVERVLAQKADMVLARTLAPGLREALIQSALAPPAPWPPGLALDQAVPIFPDAELGGADLPAYRPDLVGDRIVLRGLAGMAEHDRDKLIEEAWRRRPEATANKGLHEAFDKDAAIAGWYAAALVNAASAYGAGKNACREQRRPLSVSALDAAKDLHESFDKDAVIAGWYARALVNVAMSYGYAATTGREEAWALLGSTLETLKILYQAFAVDQEIALQYANGLFNAEPQYRRFWRFAEELTMVRRDLARGTLPKTPRWNLQFPRSQVARWC